MAEETKVDKVEAGPHGVLVIEAGNDTNGQVLFPPLKERLRGRFDTHNLRGESSDVGMMSMPGIPGVRVRFDLRARTAEVFDPLESDPELLEKVSAVHRQSMRSACTYRPRIAREAMTDDESATWLYWMMRLVAGKNARVVEGTCPPNEKEVKKAFPRARIEKDFYSSAQRPE